ncbi:unnamed protein product [Closterium sp. NIES-54]
MQQCEMAALRASFTLLHPVFVPSPANAAGMAAFSLHKPPLPSLHRHSTRVSLLFSLPSLIAAPCVASLHLDSHPRARTWTCHGSSGRPQCRAVDAGGGVITRSPRCNAQPHLPLAYRPVSRRHAARPAFCPSSRPRHGARWRRCSHAPRCHQR